MDHLIGQEVFVVTGAEEEDTSEIFVTDNRDNLNEHLMLKQPDIDGDTRVFHGVLAPAEFLPNSFHGKSTFIICVHPSKLSGGCVVEGADSPSELASEIETMIHSCSLFTIGDRIRIDQVYILYGYQLGLGLTINEDEIDEEIVFSCSIIADEAAEVENNYLDNGGI